MLRVQASVVAVGAVALVYVLGFGVHPHQVGFACVIAACYVVFAGTATYFTQQAWRASARRAPGSAAHDGDVAMPTGSAVNLDALAVRLTFRSRCLAWLSVTILGAAMLIGFVVLVARYEGPAMALESSGVRVEGVITSVIGQGEAPFDGAVDVQYFYAGRTFDTHIYRDDTSPTYQLGETVSVTVDPSDPQVATVGGSDNEGPGLVWLLAVLLVVGACAFFVGGGMLIGTSLARRKASRTAIRAGVFPPV